MLAAARARGGHWVDTFYHYGVGANTGPLRTQSLPGDLLEGRDWDLRRTDVDIDVSAAVPQLGTWPLVGLRWAQRTARRFPGLVSRTMPRTSP